MIPPSIATTLQSIMDKACQSGRLQGASLAINTRGETQAFASGMANVVEEIPATPETIFHIGSATKAITAELVWRLIENGRLSRDLPVIDALPEVNHIETLTDRRLTLAHLLSHTGGIDGDVIFDAGRGKDVLRRFMSQIHEIGLLFAPGANFSYANVSYNILGRIVEVAGGAAFEDAIAALLRKTHELSRIAVLPDDKIRYRTALHFAHREGAMLPDWFGPHSNIGSGTVLAMSMTDLSSWGVKLLATGDIVRNMRKSAVSLPFNHRYEGWGYGLTLLDGVGEKIFGHDGGTAGTATFLRVAPAQESAWAFSATGTGGVAVSREIEPMIREALKLDPATKRKPQGKPVDLRLYEGTFVRHGMEFTTKIEGEGALRLTNSGSMSSQMINGLILRPMSEQVFETVIPAIDATIWVSFHDFVAGRPQLFFALERMSRRKEELGR